MSREASSLLLFSSSRTGITTRVSHSRTVKSAVMTHLAVYTPGPVHTVLTDTRVHAGTVHLLGMVGGHIAQV